MTRLVVLCDRPLSLSRDEALTWLRRASADLAADGAIRKVSVTELESASPRWVRERDWLIEVELADSREAGRLVADPPWGELLTDLRLLGMRPCVAVADPARTTELGPAA